MATVPEAPQVSPESFKEEHKELVSKVSGPFNRYAEQVNEAITQNLTFGENFRGEVRSFTFNENKLTTKFKYNGKGTPSHMWITRVKPKPTVALIPYWDQDGKGNITVEIVGTLSADTDYTITFIIMSD